MEKRQPQEKSRAEKVNGVNCQGSPRASPPFGTMAFKMALGIGTRLI